MNINVTSTTSRLDKMSLVLPCYWQRGGGGGGDCEVLIYSVFSVCVCQQITDPLAYCISAINFCLPTLFTCSVLWIFLNWVASIIFDGVIDVDISWVSTCLLLNALDEYHIFWGFQYFCLNGRIVMMLSSGIFLCRQPLLPEPPPLAAVLIDL